MNIEFRIPSSLLDRAIRNIDSYEALAGRELNKYESGAINFRSGAIQGVIGTLVAAGVSYGVTKLVQVLTGSDEDDTEEIVGVSGPDEESPQWG